MLLKNWLEQRGHTCLVIQPHLLMSGIRLSEGARLWLLAVLVGVTVFLWAGYARTLDPGDLRLLVLGDPVAPVLGWEQYRNAPLLQYPITRNELYGLEWSSTIVFSDSIPIVAIPLRPLSSLLPQPFQYLGWWTLLSMVFQAYWGARLVQLRSRNMLEIALGCMFFATAPALLNRIGLHTALASHWILLAALSLYFSSRGARAWAWLALQLVAVSVHAYLFVMVAAIWVAHLASCYLRGLLHRRDMARAAATLGIVVLWMHALGYFLIGGGAASGAGISRFDLTSFVSGSLFTSLLPALPDVNWDGNAFLGTGILLLLSSALALGAWRRFRPAEDSRTSVAAPWTPLVIIVVLLALFAITNEIMFGGKRVAGYPLPAPLQTFYLTFRGAARMIWPAYYLIILCTVWLALGTWTRRVAWLGLATALVVQVVDIRKGVAFKAGQLVGPSPIRPFEDRIWGEIAKRYKRVVSVPAFHAQPDLLMFAWFAAQHGLGSNIGLFSRTDPAVRRAGARQHLERVLTGNHDPATVYYFPSSDLWTIASQNMAPDDLATVADGHHLLIPGGHTWWKEPVTAPPSSTPRIGTWISFGAEGNHRGLLMDGWSWQESWGLWSADPEPSLVLPVPTGERVRVSFRWLATAPPGTAQRLRIHLDGKLFETKFAVGGPERVDTFEIVTTRPLLDVRIECLEPVVASDQRVLGVGLIAARVQRVADIVADADIPDAARGPAVLDSWIPFSDDAAGRKLLQRGWSYGEQWGTWSVDRDATLVLPVPPGESLEVSLRWLAAVTSGQTRTVRVQIEDRVFDARFATDAREQQDSFNVTSAHGWVTIRLEIERPVTAPDGRMLGVGLIAARVRRVSP